ncbi:NUDIX domain-containing protein [Arthrobacter sp. Sa2CUA1]|uniref:NUDIX domain-containing protein n=1 Tax=Arthrobacter gallicola TaxID=2762225 RepID=A0ABR8UPF7_9MICC|nr:NUDIX domain-containing protein [Arthrobacter gallicola]MBD7994448.1 NUDIX domain-containing protein [Arthrobacter gallicola]
MAGQGLTRFYGSVFRRRVDTSLLLRDGSGGILIVRAGNGPWALPGGVVKSGEDPRSAAAREASAVLGDRVQAGRMLVFDCSVVPAQDGGALSFVYDGGSIAAATSEFRAAGGSLQARFLPAADCTRLLDAPEAARLAAGLRALEMQGVAELVDGHATTVDVPRPTGAPALMPRLPEVSHLLG